MVSARFRWAWGAVALLLLTAAPLAARSQGDPIKVRKDNFHVLSDQMKALVKGLGDGVPVEAMRPQVGRASDALARLPGLFPEGSGQGDTDALPAIWAEPERFKAVYGAAQARMGELSAAAAGDDRDALGAAVGRMAAACGTCHHAFRAD